MNARLITRVLAFVVTALMVTSSWASGASRAEAQAQVNAAINHAKKVGVEQATKDFNTGPDWKVKGMNVILNDMKGLVLASSLNERLIGKNTLEIKDPNGKEFVKEMNRPGFRGGSNSREWSHEEVPEVFTRGA